MTAGTKRALRSVIAVPLLCLLLVPIVVGIAVMKPAHILFDLAIKWAKGGDA